MKTRIFCILLTLALILPLSACSSGQNGTETTDGGPQTAARLAKAGVPVAENLLAAVEIARSFAA